MCEGVDQGRSRCEHPDKDGITPLMFALKEDHVQCVKELMNAGASVNTPDKDGKTPLILAVNNDYADSEYSWDMEIYKRDWDDRVPVRRSAPPMSDVEEYHIQCVTDLIKAGADVNKYKDRESRKPLLNYAAESGNEECLKILIDAGADVNATGVEGRMAWVGQSYTAQAEEAILRNHSRINHTALMCAARCGFPNILNMLLAAGANVNIRNDYGKDALFFALSYGHYKCMDILLQAGADVNCTYDNGNTVLHLGLDRKYVQSEKNCLQCIKKLLRAGIHINIFNKLEGKNALKILLRYKSTNQGFYKTIFTGVDTEVNYKDAMKLMYAAGETLEGTDEGELPEELQFEEEKLELKHICREAIRKHLLKLDFHSNLFGRIPKLGLPSLVTKYVLYDQSVDDDDDDDEDKQ